MKIPSELIVIYPSFDPAAGRDKTAILRIKNSFGAGYSLGFVPEGQAARQVTQGPLVPGPWAWASGRASVMDNYGGTGAELDRARAEGRLFEVSFGEVIEIEGLRFEVRPDHNQNIKLALLG